MTDAPDSMMEQPETMATILGVPDETKHVEIVKSALGELIERRQNRQVFITITMRPSDGRMEMNYSDDATYNEVLAVLGLAEQRVVEARYQRSLDNAAKKDPPHEH